MLKGWNNTLIFLTFFFIFDSYPLNCTQYKENPPVSELFPLQKVFVRDILFNVNWNKNMTWQTDHHLSVVQLLLRSWSRQLKTQHPTDHWSSTLLDVGLLRDLAEEAQQFTLVIQKHYPHWVIVSTWQPTILSWFYDH